MHRAQPASAGIFINGSRDEGGLSREQEISTWLELRPASNIQLELNPRYRNVKRFAQWIENIDRNGEDDISVFGELDSSVLDLTVRASLSFTPLMTLQLYLQGFVSVGDYGQSGAAGPANYADHGWPD